MGHDSEARFEAVTMANRFLFGAIPFSYPQSVSALREFVDRMYNLRLQAADCECILLRALAVLNPCTGARLPTLVEHYLAHSGDTVGNLEVFQRCVDEAIRYRGLVDPPIQQVVDSIESRYADSTLSIESLAEAVSLQPYELSRRFKRQTGISPTEYLRRVRLDQAAHSLVNTTMSVKEIWVSVGYNHAANFDHDFGRRFNVSPLRYRRRQYSGIVADTSRVFGEFVGSRCDVSDAEGVLVVDDDAALCHAAHRLLNLSGFSVVTALTGEAGLCEVHKQDFAAIIIDYRLPDCSGIDLLKRLRLSHPTTPAAAIFTADWEIEEHRALVTNLGALVFSKLCSPETLERIVRSLGGLPLRSVGAAS